MNAITVITTKSVKDNMNVLRTNALEIAKLLFPSCPPTVTFPHFCQDTSLVKFTGHRFASWSRNPDKRSIGIEKYCVQTFLEPLIFFGKNRAFLSPVCHCLLSPRLWVQICKPKFHRLFNNFVTFFYFS